MQPPPPAGSRVGQATAKSRSRMDARRRAFPSTTRGRVRAAGHGSSRHPRAGLADAATPPGKKAYESGFSRGRFHRLFHRRKRWKLTPSDTSSFRFLEHPALLNRLSKHVINTHVFSSEVVEQSRNVRAATSSAYPRGRRPTSAHSQERAEVGFSYNGLQRHTGIRRDTY